MKPRPSAERPSDLRVRPARPEDAGRIAAIEAAWPTVPGWTEERLKRDMVSPEVFCAAAECGGRIVGHGLFWIVGREAQVLTIAVDPSHVRQGVGRAILAGLWEKARAAGLDKMTLEVSVKNAPAIALYQSAGFQIVGRRPKFYNDGSDAFLMDLLL